MGGIQFGLTTDAAELAKRKLLSWLGSTIIEVADANNANVKPLGLEGWQMFGRVTQSSPARNVEYFDIKTGTPETSKGSIIIGDTLEFGISFDHPNMMGFRLSQANTFVYTPNYASDGQTDVASAGTKESATLTSGTGFKKKDMFEVDLTSVSFGGFKEIGFINSVDGNNVTFSRLPQVPANGASFKKIKGWGSAVEDDAGIELVIGAGAEVPRYKMRRISNNINNDSLIVEYYPEIEIHSPVPLNLDDSKNLITGGFTAVVMSQEGTFVDIDGNSLATYYLGKQIIIPRASTT